MAKRIDRRSFLKWSALSAVGAVLAGCQAPTAAPAPAATAEPVTIEVTRVVEGETIVEQVVVTATPEPVQKLEAASRAGCSAPQRDADRRHPHRPRWLPQQLQRVGRLEVARPRYANLANEPLWSVDFATGEIINGLADGDPKYNEDFTECTIPLRQGVAWYDGKPFTSADVVFTVETLMKYEGFNANSFFVENVKSVSAPDDHTVVFELKQANSRFHTTFLDRWGCTWIMPKHIFEGVEDPVTFEFNPFVGTGPYKLHSFDPAGFWTIWEKRADWDKSPTGIMFGEPKPKYIVFQYFANEGAKILAQLTHQGDSSTSRPTASKPCCRSARPRAPTSRPCRGW